MSRRTKPKQVSFAVDEELAEFLVQLPNRSDFIRGAVLAALRMRCPLCRGSGLVGIGIGEHYVAVLSCHPPQGGDPVEHADPVPSPSAV